VSVDLERLLEVVERLARLVLPLLDHAEAVVDEHRLLGALGLAVLDQDRLVQLERLLPVLLLEAQVGHPHQHVAVGGVDVEGLAVVLERLVGVAERAGDLGGAQEQVALLLLAEAELLGLAGQHVVDRVGAGEVAVVVVDLAEDAADLDVLRVELEDLGEQRHRLVLLVELLVVDEAGLGGEVGLLELEGRVLDRRLEVTGRLEPVAPGLVELGEADEGGHVAGVELEGLGQPELGLVGLVELLQVHLTHAGEVLDAQLRVLRQLDELAEGLDRGLPVLDLLLQAGEGDGRVVVLRVDLEDLGVGLDRPVDVLDLLLVGLAHRQEQLDLAARSAAVTSM
jgi:hypothetical protein